MKIKIPKGYILVPKVPTEKMLDAAEHEYVQSYTGTLTACPYDIWKAMIKSAPKFKDLKESLNLQV